MVESASYSLEREIQTKRWMEADGHLIVLPPDAQLEHCHRVLSRLEAKFLENPPTPSIISNYQSIIVVADGTQIENDDLKVRSLWLGNGPWTNMGAIFPDLRGALSNFETLQGVLYPETVKPHPDFTAANPQTLESWLQAVSPQRVWCLTKLLSPRKKAHLLENLILPETFTHRLGIWGIGDIGSNVAKDIRREDITRTGVSELFIGGSREPKKIEAFVAELDQMNIEGIRQPIVHGVKPGEEDVFFSECDVIFILVAASTTPPGEEEGTDVRAVQYEGNIKLLQQFIARAPSHYDGQILVGSDPVEQLTMGLYLEVKKAKNDINTHQLAGFGGMISRSRAKEKADTLGIQHFIDEGRIFGSHGKMVVAIPTHEPKYYDARQAEILSRATGHANYEVRDLGKKPFWGPEGLITEGILQMNKSGILYASPFLPSYPRDRNGAFFCTRAAYHSEAGAWAPRIEQPYLRQIMEILKRAHRYIEVTSFLPKSLESDPFAFVEAPNDHPAFHPYVMERWEEKISKEE